MLASAGGDVKGIPLSFSALPRVIDTTTSAEQAIVDIVSGLLGRAIAPDENFFAAGIDSLRGAVAVGRIVRRLGTDLSLADLFENPTAASLATVCADHHDAVDAVPDLDTELRLSIMQAGRFLRVTRALADGRRPFQELVGFGIEIDGKVTDREVVDALVRVVECHEALRTGFHLSTGSDAVRPFIVPASESADRLQVHVSDETAIDPAARRLTSRSAMAELMREPMALDRPPLLRGSLCRWTSTQATLLLAIEHQVFDGSSAEVLAGDLATALRGVRLAPAFQFREWIASQHAQVDGEPGRLAARHWRHALQDTSPYPDLGLPSPAVPGDDPIHQFTDLVEEPDFASLRRFVATFNATPAMAYLATVAMAFRTITGHKDVVVHSPIDNRTHPRSDRLIGWLSHSSITRLTIDDADSVEAVVRLVRDTAVDSYRHRFLPGTSIIRMLQPDKVGTPTRPARLYVAYAADGDSTHDFARGQLRTLTYSDEVRWADAGLTFEAEEVDGGLRVTTTIDPRTVDASFVERMHRMAVAGLRQLAADGRTAAAILETRGNRT